MSPRSFNKKFPFLVIIFSGLLIWMNSCTKDEGPLVIKPPPVPGDTMISFGLEVQAIFDVHCVRCHNQSHPFLDLREGFSYEELLYYGRLAPYVDTLIPENSILIGRLRGIEYPIMPPDGDHVSEGAIDTIATWMLQGAREN
ncbi:MAG TPA: hypothetical protein PLU53_10600 [Bacteroidia bacterium]|nr:hypothetical protein [Bacteroidia bacterium]